MLQTQLRKTYRKLLKVLLIFLTHIENKDARFTRFLRPKFFRSEKI